MAEAQRVAAAQHKNVFLNVGGNWCSWCLIFEKTVQQTPELKSDLEQNYVVVHVNWSPENENKPFLAKYGIPSFPYFIILAADGSLLKQQETSVLEADHKAANGYDIAKVRAFLHEYSPKPPRS